MSVCVTLPSRRSLALRVQRAARRRVRLSTCTEMAICRVHRQACSTTAACPLASTRAVTPDSSTTARGRGAKPQSACPPQKAAKVQSRVASLSSDITRMLRCTPHCCCCRFAIMRLTTNTLLSRYRPAQFAMQLACDESSLLPGVWMHLSKHVSVSLLMAAWMMDFCLATSFSAD